MTFNQEVDWILGIATVDHPTGEQCDFIKSILPDDWGWVEYPLGIEFTGKDYGHSSRMLEVLIRTANGNSINEIEQTKGFKRKPHDIKKLLAEGIIRCSLQREKLKIDSSSKIINSALMQVSAMEKALDKIIS